MAFAGSSISNLNRASMKTAPFLLLRCGLYPPSLNFFQTANTIAGPPQERPFAVQSFL